MKKEVKTEKRKISMLSMDFLKDLLRRAGILFGAKDEHRAKRIRRRPFTKRFMARPELGRMSWSAKIELGMRVYTHMVNNPDFASASPSPDVLLAAIHDLEEALIDAEENNGIKQRSALEMREGIFDTVFKAVVQSVDVMANGRESVYRSAGMEPVRAKK